MTRTATYRASPRTTAARRRAFGVAMALAIACRAPTHTGRPLAALDPSTAAGALVLSGGEFVHPELRERFVRLAGGPQRRFVYVPTASSGIRLPSGFEYEPRDDDAPNPRDSAFAAELARWFGVERVAILHTRNRATADGDAFLRVLRDADGVWLSGGNAGRLADAYLGTRAQRELEALLRRGGVVGGNSAGAIIQGSFIVRGRPDKPVLMAPGRTRGFGFLQNTAVNPHLLSQKRESELVTVLDAHPALLGLGIPDSVGLVVRAGVAEVLGDGPVAIYDNAKHGCCWYWWLRRGERLDLARRAKLP